MSQHILKKPVIDLNTMEGKIQRRLQRGKTKLLISHILFFIMAVSVIFFVI